MKVYIPRNFLTSVVNTVLKFYEPLEALTCWSGSMIYVITELWNKQFLAILEKSIY